MLARLETDGEIRRAGRLRVYLGMAPGVGKTYEMLQEAHRRVARGTDLVVGFVEAHGRPRTEELLDGLEIIPRRRIEYRGVTLEEMDTDAVIERHPAVALVDELAHTNAPGSPRTKRWQDVERHPRRRNRRHQHLQRAAPRVGRRCGRDDHRRPGPRAAPGRRARWPRTRSSSST